MDMGMGSGGGGDGMDNDGMGSSDGGTDNQTQDLELQIQVLVQNQILNLVRQNLDLVKNQNLSLVHQNQFLHLLYLGQYYLESLHSSSSFSFTVNFMCIWVKVLGHLSCVLRIKMTYSELNVIKLLKAIIC